MSEQKEEKEGWRNKHSSSEMHKDLTLLAAHALSHRLRTTYRGGDKEKGLVFLDAYAGQGVRGLRVAQNVTNVQGVIVNDVDEGASRDIEKELKDSKSFLESRNIQVVQERLEISELLAKLTEQAVRLTLDGKNSAGDKEFLVPNMIDMDPFGSAWHALPLALRLLTFKGGLLSVTLLDLKALSPSGAGGACFGRYNAFTSDPSAIKHHPKFLHSEIGLRIAVGSALRLAAQVLYPTQPKLLFAGDTGFGIRIFLMVPKAPVLAASVPRSLFATVHQSSHNEGSETPRNLGFTNHCMTRIVAHIEGTDSTECSDWDAAQNEQSDFATKINFEEVNCATTGGGSTGVGGQVVEHLWKCEMCPSFTRFTTQSFGPCCPECSGNQSLIGPLYLGGLMESDFSQQLLNMLQEKGSEVRERLRVEALLRDLGRELSEKESVLFYDMPSLSAFFELVSTRAPKRRELVAKLEGLGFKVSDSHVSPYQGVKTTAPTSVVFKAFAELAGLQPRHLDAAQRKNQANRNLQQNKDLRPGSCCLQKVGCSESLQTQTATHGAVKPAHVTEGDTGIKGLNRRERRRLKFQQSATAAEGGEGGEGRGAGRHGVQAEVDQVIVNSEAKDAHDKRESCHEDGETGAAKMLANQVESESQQSVAKAEWAESASVQELRRRVAEACDHSTLDLSHICGEEPLFELRRPLVIRQSLSIIASACGGDAGPKPILSAPQSVCLVVKGHNTRVSLEGLRLWGSEGAVDVADEGQIDMISCHLTSLHPHALDISDSNITSNSNGQSVHRHVSTELEQPAKRRKGVEGQGLQDVSSGSPGLPPTTPKGVESQRFVDMMNVGFRCNWKGLKNRGIIGVWGLGRLVLKDCVVESQPSVLCGSAVMLSGKGMARINSSTFSNPKGSAIEVRGGASLRIEESKIQRSGKAGVYVHASAKAFIAKCSFSDTGYASIEVSGSGTARIEGVEVNKSRKGGVFVHSNGVASIENSAFSGSSMAQVHVKWGGKILICNSQIRLGKQAGILIQDDGSEVVMDGCNVLENKGPGVCHQGGSLRNSAKSTEHSSLENFNLDLPLFLS